MTNKEAIANLNHIYGIVSPDIQRSLDLAIKALEERPQGEWKCAGLVFCNQCGRSHGTHKTNFCPNCGAKMVGGSEDGKE